VVAATALVTAGRDGDVKESQGDLRILVNQTDHPQRLELVLASLNVLLRRV
jgi:hypothetical protein